MYLGKISMQGLNALSSEVLIDFVKKKLTEVLLMVIYENVWELGNKKLNANIVSIL